MEDEEKDTGKKGETGELFLKQNEHGLIGRGGPEMQQGQDYAKITGLCDHRWQCCLAQIWHSESQMYSVWCWGGGGCALNRSAPTHPVHSNSPYTSKLLCGQDPGRKEPLP